MQLINCYATTVLTYTHLFANITRHTHKACSSRMTRDTTLSLWLLVLRRAAVLHELFQGPASLMQESLHGCQAVAIGGYLHQVIVGEMDIERCKAMDDGNGSIVLIAYWSPGNVG